MLLGAMINHCVRLMEKNETLPIIETETAMVENRLVELIQTKFGDKMDLTVFSAKMPQSSDWWANTNTEIRSWVISEYNKAQPGRSATKWGIHKNGLAFVAAVCSDILAQ